MQSIGAKFPKTYPWYLFHRDDVIKIGHLKVLLDNKGVEIQTSDPPNSAEQQELTESR